MQTESKSWGKVIKNIFLILFLISAPCLAFADKAEEPRLKQARTITDAAQDMAKALAVTVAGLLAAAKAYKHFSKHEQGLDTNRIQVLSKKVVGSKSQLLLVSVDGQRLLLSTNAEETHLISELHNFEPPPSAFMPETEPESAAG